MLKRNLKCWDEKGVAFNACYHCAETMFRISRGTVHDETHEVRREKVFNPDAYCSFFTEVTNEWMKMIFNVVRLRDKGQEEKVLRRE